MTRTQAVAAALLAGLLAGVWIGSAADRRALRRARAKGPNAERIAKRLTRELKLDEAQSSKVREILMARAGKHESLRREQEARFKALRAEIDAEIEKLLNDEQKKRFAEKRAEWEKRRAPPPAP